jgi:hypothetical protein
MRRFEEQEPEEELAQRLALVLLKPSVLHPQIGRGRVDEEVENALVLRPELDPAVGLIPQLACSEQLVMYAIHLSTTGGGLVEGDQRFRQHDLLRFTEPQRPPGGISAYQPAT